MILIFAIAAMINATAAGLWAAAPPSTARTVFIFGHLACCGLLMSRILARRCP